MDPRETLSVEGGPHPVQHAVGSVYVINAHELAGQERLAEAVAQAVVVGEPVLVECLLRLARAVVTENCGRQRQSVSLADGERNTKGRTDVRPLG